MHLQSLLRRAAEAPGHGVQVSLYSVSARNRCDAGTRRITLLSKVVKVAGGPNNTLHLAGSDFAVNVRAPPDQVRRAYDPPAPAIVSFPAGDSGTLVPLPCMMALHAKSCTHTDRL